MKIDLPIDKPGDVLDLAAFRERRKECAAATAPKRSGYRMRAEDGTVVLDLGDAEWRFTPKAAREWGDIFHRLARAAEQSTRGGK